MAVTPANITQGPATVYTAAFGSTEPADSNAAIINPPAAPWTDIGGTQGGVVFEVDNTYTAQDVDQLVDPVGARLTKRAMTCTFKIAETTLNNLNVAAMNSLMTPSSGVGYTTSDPQTTTSATQPTYIALILDAWAPTLPTGAAARRRIILRKCLSQAKIQFAYNMQNNAVFEVVFTLYYVSSSISPFHVAEQTA